MAFEQAPAAVGLRRDVPAGISFTPAGFAAAFGGFLLIGAIAASYGPLLAHVAGTFGLTLEQAGLLLAMPFAGSVLGVGVAILAVDRLPARIPLGAGTLLLGLGATGVGLAGTWHLLLAAAALAGVGAAMLDLGLNQLLAHSALPNRTSMLNQLNAAFGFGAVLGPLLVALLGADRMRPLFLGFAAASLVVAAGMVGVHGRADHAPRQPEGADAATFTQGLAAVVGAFVVAYVLYVGVESATSGWMATHLEALGQGAGSAAVWTGAFWLAMAIGRLAGSSLSRRAGPGTLVVASCLAAVGALLVAAVPGLAAAGYVASGFAFAMVFPTGLVWAASLTAHRPRATTLLLVASMVGGVVVPPLIGVAQAALGVRTIPLLLAAVAAACTAAFLAVPRLARGRTW